jgi:DNA-binding protein HU-beta
MNKTQLIDALAARIGDRRTAVTAVDGMLETIVDTVRAGDSVTLTGFGVFEGRARAARVARNPRTGESVAVPATTVPAFRPGVGFRTAVGGGAPVPHSAPSRSRAAPAPVAAAVEEADVPPARKAAKAKSGASFAAKDTKDAKPAKRTAKADKAEKSGKSGKSGKGKAKAKK